jgi:hypothetical protein
MRTFVLLSLCSGFTNASFIGNLTNPFSFRSVKSFTEAEFELENEYPHSRQSSGLMSQNNYQRFKNIFSASWYDQGGFSTSTDQAFNYLSSKFQRRGQEDVHICLFSDRLEAISVPIRSVVDKTRAPESVHFWIVTVNDSYNKIKDYFAKTESLFLGAKIHVLNLDEVTNDLIREEVIPVWKWKTFGSSTFLFSIFVTNF